MCFELYIGFVFGDIWQSLGIGIAQWLLLLQVLVAMALGAVIGYERESRGRARDCPPGQEFYFCESQSFVMPTGIVANSVPEFFEALGLTEPPRQDFQLRIDHRGREYDPINIQIAPVAGMRPKDRADRDE